MTPQTKQPIIGIMLDYEHNGSFSNRPYYALRCAYFEAISNAGGIPVAIPYLKDSTKDFLEIIDGLLLPGGFYSFPTSFYNYDNNNDGTLHPRAQFESDFLNYALEQDIPVLGICAGMQLIAAISGALVERDVHSSRSMNINHLNEKPAEELAHKIYIRPKTLLHKITQCNEMSVNTAHQEGIDPHSADTISNLIINSWAPDGVIEGIELSNKRFVLGVQWHPEFFANQESPHFSIFKALITQAISNNEQ